MGIKNIIGELQVNGKRVLTTEDGVGCGGGGGKAIIDVDTLPTDNINEDAFYRVRSAEIIAKFIPDDFTTAVRVVDSLPTQGEDAYDLAKAQIISYLNLADKKLYCYCGERTQTYCQMMGYDLSVVAPYISNGWIETTIGIEFILNGTAYGDYSYGGVVTKEPYEVDDSTLFVLYERPKLYQYKMPWTGKMMLFNYVGELEHGGVTFKTNVFFVDELPSVGIEAIDQENLVMTGYYCTSDDKFYVYSSGIWMETHQLLNYATGESSYKWGGVKQLDFIEETFDDDLFELLVGFGYVEPYTVYILTKSPWNEVGGNGSVNAEDEDFGEPSIILTVNHSGMQSDKLKFYELDGLTKIDWGDGEVFVNTDELWYSFPAHEYKGSAATYVVKIYGNILMGNQCFQIRDGLDDMGNMNIRTIVIREGVFGISHLINPQAVSNNPVTVIMDRLSPVLRLGETPFDSNVTKIIAPNEQAKADLINAWNQWYDLAYDDIIQAPITEIPAGSGGGASGGGLGEPTVIIGLSLQSETVKLTNFIGTTAIDWGDGTITNHDGTETTFTYYYDTKTAFSGAPREIKVYGCYKVGDDAFVNFANQLDTVTFGCIKELGKNVFATQYLNRPVRFLSETPPRIANVDYNAMDRPTGTTSYVSFPVDVNKIVVPSKEAVSRYNFYWNNVYKSVIQYPFTDISDILSALPVYNGEVE